MRFNALAYLEQGEDKRTPSRVGKPSCMGVRCLDYRHRLGEEEGMGSREGKGLVEAEDSSSFGMETPLGWVVPLEGNWIKGLGLQKWRLLLAATPTSRRPDLNGESSLR